jgi:hypothetical protein
MCLCYAVVVICCIGNRKHTGQKRVSPPLLRRLLADSSHPSALSRNCFS